MNGHPPTRIMQEVPLEWQQLMVIIQRVGYGEVTIKINNGKPDLVETGIKKTKLGVSNEDFKNQLKVTGLL